MNCVRATSSPLIVWVYHRHSNFRGGLRKRMYFETEYVYVMALQGHLRSLISVPVENAYATSHQWSDSNTGYILPRFRDITGFSWKKQRPHFYFTRILACFHELLSMLGLRGAIISRVITFEVTKAIRPRYTASLTDERTDRRTTLRQQYRALYLHRFHLSKWI